MAELFLIVVILMLATLIVIASRLKRMLSKIEKIDVIVENGRVPTDSLLQDIKSDVREVCRSGDALRKIERAISRLDGSAHSILELLDESEKFNPPGHRPHFIRPEKYDESK